MQVNEAWAVSPISGQDGVVATPGRLVSLAVGQGMVDYTLVLYTAIR